MTDLPGTIAVKFMQRRDVYAVQHANGTYAPVREPISRAAIESHLAGTSTLGHYLVDQDGMCRIFAFDIDLCAAGVWKESDDREEIPIKPREVWLEAGHPARTDLLVQLRCMAEGLALRTKRLCEVPVAVSYSGSKGLHVYGLCGPTNAGDAREVAKTVLDSFGCFEPARGNNFFRHSYGEYPNLEIEIFPKQDKVGKDGFGNLMRLPLGVNKKSGQAGFFVDLTTPINELNAADSEAVLSEGGYEW